MGLISIMFHKLSSNEKNHDRAAIRAQGSWARSANATSELCCSPVEVKLTWRGFPRRTVRRNFCRRRSSRESWAPKLSEVLFKWRKVDSNIVLNSWHYGAIIKLCKGKKMAESCTEGITTKRRRSGSKGHRFKTRCQQELFTAKSPFTIYIFTCDLYTQYQFMSEMYWLIDCKFALNVRNVIWAPLVKDPPGRWRPLKTKK